MAQTQCPSGCSCLLPSDAKAKGYTLCGGKQVLCGYDKAQNPMYCYQKPATTTVTTKPTTTVTTVTPVTSQCPSGCSCMSPESAKQYSYTLCGGKQILCGYDKAQNPMYCYQKPATTTATTAVTAAPVQCPSSCSCMDAGSAKNLGVSYCGGKQILCGYDNYQNPIYCYEKPPTTEPTAVAAISQAAMTAVIPPTTEPTTMAVAMAPARCFIGGSIFQFYHNASTLKIQLTNLDTGTVTYQGVTPVITGDLVSHFSYSILVNCNGNYRIEPVYQPYTGACAWTGTFTPSRGNEVRMSGDSETGWDFSYVPEDSNIPEVAVVPNPAEPEINEDVRINIEAADDSVIAFMAAKYDMVFTDGTRRSVDWFELTPMAGISYRPGDNPPWTGHFWIRDDNLARVEITARACDSGGNERWGSGTVMFGSCEDGIQNRDEQRVDCGGAYCSACIECSWCGDHVIPLQINGNPDRKIDVIFVPDSTYGGNTAAFVADIWDVIENGYYENDAFSDNRGRFNYYYLDDEAEVEGYHACEPWPDCSFTPPLGGCTDYINAVTFAESVAVLHTDDFRDWAGSRCGKGVFCSEPTSFRTFVHESGHAIFGLKDEYCCDSSYSQNNPNPNIWTNETACRNDAAAEGWDPDDCVQFCTPGSGNCGSGFWKNDPDRCVMRCSQACGGNCCNACGGANAMCQYEPACMRRVNWVLSRFS